MSSLIKNTAVRAIDLGIFVPRASAVLPQTAQTPIYTIAGGLVLITGFVGVVTTIVQAQATTVQFISTPTVGTAVSVTNATGDINGKEVGSTVVLPSGAIGGTALVSNAGGTLLQTGLGLTLGTGTLDFKTVASSTGAMKFLLTYIPLDTGASVAAA